MEIIDLDPANLVMVQQAAALLVEGFKVQAPNAWPDLVNALQEVRKALEPGKLCHVAIDKSGRVLGWIGGTPHYDGHVWELHPLVVDPRRRRQGIGRALVMVFEGRVRQRGGITIQLGTDDEADMTSLYGVNLYPNPLDHLANIRNLRGHPYEFYQKLGFSITGVVPDANGFGKPDILMCKRVRK